MKAVAVAQVLIASLRILDICGVGLAVSPEHTLPTCEFKPQEAKRFEPSVSSNKSKDAKNQRNATTSWKNHVDYLAVSDFHFDGRGS